MTIKPMKKRNNSVTIAVTVLLALFTLILGFAFSKGILAQTVFGKSILSSLNGIFALDSTQMWWYVTRSAGIIAYLLLWFSTVWGLAIPSKLLSPALEQNYTFDFHEFISLLAIGFLILHISVLMVDRYLPYNIIQILVPFTSPYRPFWVGIGIISFYLTILVTVTFYLRKKIGSSTFRAIHLLSLVSYMGATLHGLYAGTDSPLVTMQILYKGTALVVGFLTIYYIALKIQHKTMVKKKVIPHRLQPHRHARQ